MSSLIATPGGVAVLTPFDRAFVDALKAQVPYAGRRWDQAGKRWLVDPAYADAVAALIYTYFGESVAPPTAPAPTAPVTVMKQVMYIGRCKERSLNVWTASGYADGGWSLSFPEAVLRAYFNDPEGTPAEPQQPDSLYKALGLKAFEADPAAIKTAYRRMARTWHPDVCREPDAAERFREIQRAWDILSNDKTRRKYDCGLTLQMRHEQQPTRTYVPVKQEYRTPLTCGLLLVEGIEKLGVLQVSKILHWADIVNAAGQTMVSSWPMGAQEFVTSWV